MSPSAADALYAGLVSAKVTVTRIAAHIDHVIRTAGEVMWMLLNTAFVRAVSTTAAGIAAGFLVVHEATSGALFEWIVRLTPKAVGWVAWITNPWWCLAGVVASTGLAMILAFLRLLKSADASSHDPDGDGPDQPASAVDWSEWQQSIGGDALDSLVDQLHVSVAPNGSVTVSGIPDWVPTDLRRPLAKVASDAAIRQWERTARHRPTPSRDDRRLFTKAARDAVRQFGSSRSQRPRSAA